MNQISNFRYSFKIGDIIVSCKPLGLDKLRLITERERGQIYYRTKASGKLLFKNGDYNLLMKLQNSSSRCQEIGFLIEAYNSSLRAYEFLWQGFFTLNDCEISLDR